MKILKIVTAAILLLMLIGWVWKGIQTLLFLSILLAGAYLAYQLFFAKSEEEEVENI